jgi:hypothetical protein
VLAEQLSEARAQAASWEAQAQDSLSTIARLQDCLEEGAAWDSGATSHGAGHAAAETSAAGAAADADAEVRQLKAEAARRQAAAAAADLRARALAAELLKARAAAGAAGRALLPLLSGVEARLRATRDGARGER